MLRKLSWWVWAEHLSIYSLLPVSSCLPLDWDPLKAKNTSFLVNQFCPGNSLAVQWRTLTAEGPGSIPGQDWTGHDWATKTTIHSKDFLLISYSHSTFPEAFGKLSDKKTPWRGAQQSLGKECLFVVESVSSEPDTPSLGKSNGESPPPSTLRWGSNDPWFCFLMMS